MDRLAIIQEQKKYLKQRLDFPFQEKIETMDRLALIEEQQIVETAVNIFHLRKRLKLWIDWL